ncbi:hypothetical protein BT93_E1580 [Corymbia citriodora subsp. variegata]|nr:hypothetical protein BT93_E1580 [Corymbia citriodora subsp. variegata]
MAAIDPEERNEEGPDIFGFYSRGVAELLGEEDDFLPFSEDTSPREPVGAADKDADASGWDRKKGDGCSTSGALFDDGIAPGFSDTRRERLKSFLRRAAFDLSREVDKMHEPVLKLHQLQTHFRSSREQLSCSAASSDGDVVERPHKKINKFSSSSSGFAGKNTQSKFSQKDLVANEKVRAIETRSAPCQSPQMSKSLHNNSRSKSEGAAAPLLGSKEAANRDDRDVNDDLQFLMGSDRSRVDQLLKKYSDEHSSKLDAGSFSGMHGDIKGLLFW